jgi:hypothetical protein
MSSSRCPLCCHLGVCLSSSSCSHLSLSLSDLIAAEEVRPFLNAHFLVARMLSKVLSSSSEPPHQRTRFMVRALHRYQWLLQSSERVCEQKQVSLEEVFGQERALCREMIDLLPAKIDRMHYLGEGGL